MLSHSLLPTLTPRSVSPQSSLTPLCHSMLIPPCVPSPGPLSSFRTESKEGEYLCLSLPSLLSVPSIFSHCPVFPLLVFPVFPHSLLLSLLCLSPLTPPHLPLPSPFTLAALPPPVTSLTLSLPFLFLTLLPFPCLHTHSPSQICLPSPSSLTAPHMLLTLPLSPHFLTPRYLLCNPSLPPLCSKLSLSLPLP